MKLYYRADANSSKIHFSGSGVYSFVLGIRNGIPGSDVSGSGGSGGSGG